MQSLHPSHVAFLLKSLDIKKASGLDKIPPELVKAVSDILSVPLSQLLTIALRMRYSQMLRK